MTFDVDIVGTKYTIRALGYTVDVLKEGQLVDSGIWDGAFLDLPGRWGHMTLTLLEEACLYNMSFDLPPAPPYRAAIS